MSQHTPDTYCFQGCADVSLDNSEMIRMCPLHAAAPELLAALEALTYEVLWITDQTDDGRLEAIDRLHRDGAAIEAARAAIARAKGETA